MRLIINIPDSVENSKDDLVIRATKAFGRCRIEVDRPEGAVEAIQAVSSEHFATQARAYLALAKRHSHPLSLAGFRFAVPSEQAEALCNAMRDSVGGQCRAEDLIYCDSHSQLLMLLPQTLEVSAIGFCQRMIVALQGAVKIIGFSHPERVVYCALAAFDTTHHSTIAEMLHEIYNTLKGAYEKQQVGVVVHTATRARENSAV